MSQTGSFITALKWETTDAEGPTRAEYQANWNAMDGHAHDNRGTGQGVRCLQTTSTPTQTGDVQIDGDTLQWWGASSSQVVYAVNPAVAVSSLMFSGPAGVATTRFCGILATSGSPATGTWKQWDFGYDEGGGIFLCTVAGSPGTWIQIGGPMTGDLRTTLRNTSDAGWVLGYGQTVDGTTATYSNLWSYVNANGLVGSDKPFTGTQAALVLPDFRSQVLVGMDAMGGVAKNVIAALSAVGKTTGEATHALTIAELAAHTHAGLNGVGFTDSSTIIGVPAGVTNAFPDAVAGTTASTGSGTAHNNVQPSYAVNIQIKL